MDQPTLDALNKWKAHCYRPTDIPFALAVESLTSTTPLVEARQSETRKTDWVLCRADSSNPATFVFAGVFAEADPYHTGNLVPNEEPIPPGLDENRVARHAGYKPAYSYAIETYHDKDIWELHAALDAYMGTVQGFNSRQVKRRAWQSGSTWHWRYYFRVPMFLTCESRGGRPEPPPGLHPWVVAAHQKSRNYRANPVHPVVCGLEGGRLQRIEDCTPNVLEYGDVISLVFTLVFVEDRDDWGPVTMISHIIRVQHANKAAYKLTASLMPADPPLDDSGLGIGTVVDPLQVIQATDTIDTVSASCFGAASRSITIGGALPVPAIHSAAATPTIGTLSAIATRSLPDATTALIAMDRSGVEMDVDDDGRGPPEHVPDSVEGFVDDDGTGSSGASTLADAPAATQDAAEPTKVFAKKRSRPRSGSDDDSDLRGRHPRSSVNALGRRGAKSAK